MPVVWQPDGAATDVLERGGMRLCRIWTITRADGTVYRLTDHDQSIPYYGETFDPANSATASILRREQGLNEADRDIGGAIDGTVFTFDDLRAGKWRDARVLERHIDWKFPALGPIREDYFIVRNVTFTGERWEVTFGGIAGTLERVVGRKVTRTCPYVFQGTDCGKDASADEITGATVLSVTTQRLKFVSGSVSVRNLVQAKYDHGAITFTANAGGNEQIRVPIKSFVSTSTDATIELRLPLPFDIGVSDVFTLHPGCRKTVEACNVTWSNFTRFGGYPFLPGGDRANAAP